MTSVHVDELVGGAGRPGERPGRAASVGTRATVAARALPALLVALLLVAGCGGGGEEDSAVPAGSGGRERPRVEQPAGDDDPAAIQPILEDLLERYDEVVNEVLANPGLARDEGSPLIREYLSLYSPENPAPEQAIERWVSDAEAGRTTQPAQPGEAAVTSRIDGDIQAVSPDEVRFPTCNELRYATYDADGNLLDMVPYLEQPGEATAVRVEGQWVFQQLTAFQGEASCATEATTEEPS